MLRLCNSTGHDIYYHRFDETYKVGVIEEKGTGYYKEYRIKILEIIQENPIIAPLKIGEELICTKRKNILDMGID
ncbi:MAG: hypothetical protein Q7R52_05620 [archaeon]|nr:hypothetical protein [archaeon]